MTARALARRGVVLAGVPESVRQARAVVRRELGDGPGTDAAVLAVSELAANAVRYTRSGLPGGTFTVSVQAGPGLARIAVTDAGSTTRPRARRARRGSEHGRGLAIVDALSARWGSERAGAGQLTWCEIPCRGSRSGGDSRKGDRMKPPAEFTRDDVRPEDRAAFDSMQRFDERIAKILAGHGGEVICPRCNLPACGWPLKRPDRCSEPGAAQCMRDPETVLADIARRNRRRSA